MEEIFTNTIITKAKALPSNSCQFSCKLLEALGVPVINYKRWGTKTQTRIQHGGRSTSACEENLVKKSNGNEGKCNFTYLDALKS